MKRLAFVVDAAADLPYAELDDRTPLECARMPAARALAREGRAGLVRVASPEADASRGLFATLCGLPPAKARRIDWGPVGAAAVLGSCPPGNFYLLVEFISVDENGEQFPVFPATPEEQTALMRGLEEALTEVDRRPVKLHRLDDRRMVMELRETTMPWPRSVVEFTYRRFLRRLPPRVRPLVKAAENWLRDQPVNAVRIDLGEPPLQSLWCWGGGTQPPPPPEIRWRGGLALASPDPLIRGLAAGWGIPFHELPDPYSPSARPLDPAELAACAGEEETLMLWIPAPFSGRRFEGPAEKVRRLDAVDYNLLAPIRDLVSGPHPCRVLILAGGLRHRGRPESGNLPYVIRGLGVEADGHTAWAERAEADQPDLPGCGLQTILKHFRSDP